MVKFQASRFHDVHLIRFVTYFKGILQQEFSLHFFCREDLDYAFGDGVYQFVDLAG